MQLKHMARDCLNGVNLNVPCHRHDIIQYMVQNKIIMFSAVHKIGILSPFELFIKSVEIIIIELF